MLRKIRITLAVLFLIGITLLLAGIGGQWWGWMAKLQFLPSFLALNAAVLAGILLLTLLLGRVYCSVICPLGVFQDVVIFIRRICGNILTRMQSRRFARLKRKGVSPLPKPKVYAKSYGYRKEHKIVRWVIFAVVGVTAIAGTQLFIALLAPYSAYGRIVRSIAGLAEGESVVPQLLITAGITLLVILFLSWSRGRAYCNTICPVGTLLSLFSRVALFRPTIDEAKCVSCGKCGKRCKASCIDTAGHKIDGGQCVMCLDCIGNCSTGAIRYRFVGFGRRGRPEGGSGASSSPEKVDKGRRAFMLTAAMMGTGLAARAQNKRLDGGLAAVLDKQVPERSGRLVPPGAVGVRHFYSHCTACQLCVSSCPNNVLRPSTDLGHFLQPQMGYEKGYCRPECTACSNVCPAGAILPLTREEKHITRIGTAAVDFGLCLAANGEASCGNCSRHCPTGAIRMVKSGDYKFSIPVVMEEQCIGCGACENLCPSRPISAITVNGLSTHIKKS